MAASADAAAAAPAADSDDGADVPVAEVGSLIEALNEAIDAVNVLEDECQADAARHLMTRRALQFQLAALEGEGGGRPWQAQAITMAESMLVCARARRQLHAAEQAALHAQDEHGQLNDELASEGLWEARMLLTSKLTASRGALTMANKALQTARKAVSTATSREEKARRQFQRAHTLEASRHQASGVPSPPFDDELALLERQATLAHELSMAEMAEAAALSEIERRKEVAAARVSDAMLALEVMSNEIHSNRMSSLPAAQGGAEMDGAASLASAADRSGDSGGDSDFVVDDSESSGDEAGAAHRRPRSSPAPPRSVKRERQGRADGASAADELEAGIQATRTAVTRLLRKAGELVSSAGGAQPVSRLATGTGTTQSYRMDPAWFGVAWSDSESVDRLRAECVAVESQHL